MRESRFANFRTTSRLLILSGVCRTQSGPRRVGGDGTNQICGVRWTLYSVNWMHHGVLFVSYSHIDGQPVELSQSWCPLLLILKSRISRAACCVLDALNRHDGWLRQTRKNWVATVDSQQDELVAEWTTYRTESPQLIEAGWRHSSDVLCHAEFLIEWRAEISDHCMATVWWHWHRRSPSAPRWRVERGGIACQITRAPSCTRYNHCREDTHSCISIAKYDIVSMHLYLLSPP